MLNITDDWGARRVGACADRAMMALIGTGSVSSYVLQNAELPVAVIRENVQLTTASRLPV